MNRVFLIGNLTADPEERTTQSGINMCRFTLAVKRRFTSASGDKEVDFINIVAWRDLADNCGKYLKKGNKAAVCGAMQTRAYDSADGSKRYVTEIAADEVQFLTLKTEDKPAEVKQGLKPVDDDLPF